MIREGIKIINGLKFDEDRAFGAINLRRAFNQVDILEKGDYGQNGEFIGLDVKALRTQRKEKSLEHLKNSREIFLKLLEVVRTINCKKMQEYIEERDYERMELYILKSLMGFRLKIVAVTFKLRKEMLLHANVGSEPRGYLRRTRCKRLR